MSQSSKRSIAQAAGSVLYSQCGFRATALVLMFLPFGFSQTAAAASPDESAEPAELTEVEMVAVMEQHYRSAIAAHDALIRDDIETLKSRLAEIETQTLPPSAPPGWQPYHDRLREAARGASAVTDLETAGAVMAEVAEACGNCHAAVQPGKIYFWPAPPEGEVKLATTMRTHQWATERLWEGVTGPFDAAWERGAAALAEARVFGEGDVRESSLLARESVLRELGRNAQAATDLRERALIYGRLLGTCAGCHQEAGITIEDAKPVPPWQE